MAEPSAKLSPTGTPEADAYAFTTFHYMKDGKETSFRTPCLIKAQILGLKEDHPRELGPPDSQRWYYNGELMSDEKTFLDYKINGTDSIDITVESSND